MISEFICTNKWCKCLFKISKEDYYTKKITTCGKCRSFDTELSGGVSFDSKQYSGDRNDGKAHEMSFKFSDYIKGKWGNIWSK